MRPITQQQYEDILFNPELTITERTKHSRGVHTTKLMMNNRVVATYTVRGNDVKYMAKDKM